MGEEEKAQTPDGVFLNLAAAQQLTSWLIDEQIDWLVNPHAFHVAEKTTMHKNRSSAFSQIHTWVTILTLFGHFVTPTSLVIKAKEQFHRLKKKKK